MKNSNLLLCALCASAVNLFAATNTNVVVSSSATLTGLTARVQGLENNLAVVSNGWTSGSGTLATATANLLTSITNGTITINGTPLSQLGITTNAVLGWIAATNAATVAAVYAATTNANEGFGMAWPDLDLGAFSGIGIAAGLATQTGMNAKLATNGNSIATYLSFSTDTNTLYFTGGVYSLSQYPFAWNGGGWGNAQSDTITWDEGNGYWVLYANEVPQNVYTAPDALGPWSSLDPSYDPPPTSLFGTNSITLRDWHAATTNAANTASVAYAWAQLASNLAATAQSAAAVAQNTGVTAYAVALAASNALPRKVDDLNGAATNLSVNGLTVNGVNSDVRYGVQLAPNVGLAANGATLATSGAPYYVPAAIYPSNSSPLVDRMIYNLGGATGITVVTSWAFNASEVTNGILRLELGTYGISNGWQGSIQAADVYVTNNPAGDIQVKTNTLKAVPVQGYSFKLRIQRITGASTTLTNTAYNVGIGGWFVYP